METNIQLLHAARRALDAVQKATGESRDATVRRLLEEHVVLQEQVSDPAERLSHISTVLRYPLPPADKREVYRAAPLRVRISQDLATRARAVSLRLPGQPPRRGGRDYQARPITDAVVTAIARREPIQDPELDGLTPLLRHRAAEGLWRLAVAATATRTETKLFTRSWNPFATEDRITQELLFNQVAWHSEWRLEVVRVLAKHYLTGPDADAAEHMLFEQGREFEFAFVDWLHRTGLEDDGVGKLPRPFSNHEGRAGGAVWRAERAIAKVGFVNWLAAHDRESVHRVTPPGWGLQVPASWSGTVARIGSPELSHLSRWVRQRQVLQLPIGSAEQPAPAGSRVLVWPLHTTDDGDRTPVSGLQVVLEQLHRMQPADAAELILRDHRFPSADEDDDFDGDELDDELDDEGDEGDEGDKTDGEQIVWGPIEVPAYVARRLGLVNEATFTELLRDAEAETRSQMDDLLAALPPDLADEELTAATSFPALFSDLLHRRGVAGGFRETKPRWMWPVVSLADEVARGSSPETLTWLTEQLLRRYRQELWGSGYEAWKAAAALYNY